MAKTFEEWIANDGIPGGVTDEELELLRPCWNAAQRAERAKCERMMDVYREITSGVAKVLGMSFCESTNNLAERVKQALDDKERSTRERLVEEIADAISSKRFGHFHMDAADAEALADEIRKLGRRVMWKKFSNVVHVLAIPGYLIWAATTFDRGYVPAPYLAAFVFCCLALSELCDVLLERWGGE